MIILILFTVSSSRSCRENMESARTGVRKNRRYEESKAGRSWAPAISFFLQG